LSRAWPRRFYRSAFTDARAERSAWLTILVCALIGAVWAAVLAPQKNRADLRRAAWLGVYAWLPALIVAVLFVAVCGPYLLPSLIVICIPVLLSGAGVGAALAGLLRLEGLVPPLMVVTRTRRRLTPLRRRSRI